MPFGKHAASFPALAKDHIESYMFVWVEEHKDNHHGVVWCPPDDEGDNDDQRDSEGLDLRLVDQSPSIDIIFPHCICALVLEDFIAL